MWLKPRKQKQENLYKLNGCRFKDKVIELQSVAVDVNSGPFFFSFFHTHDISLTSVQYK